MTNKANYFKLGMFMLVSATLLVAGVIILGAGALNKSMLPMETYIEGSVQGLSVGAPVKFRGVPIGRVDKIGFAGTTYPESMHTTRPDSAVRSYVMISFSVHPDILEHQSISDSEVPGAIAKEVERGLRVRMATIGITGNAYLDMDYLPPNEMATLAIDWVPRTVYIPSAPGQLSRIVSSAESILNQVQNSGIPKVVDHLDKLLIDADQAIAELDIPAMKLKATALFADLSESNAALKKILENPRIPQILDSTSSTLTRASTTVDHVDKLVENATLGIGAFASDLPAISANLKNVSDKLDKLLASERTQKTLDGLAATSQDMPAAVAQLQRTLRRIDDLISTQQQGISQIIQNLRATTANLDQLTDSAKRNPSGVLFGDPPPKSLPGEK